MHGAPSVQMSEIPPGLAPWMLEEMSEEEGEGTNDDDHRASNNWYDGDKDRELDSNIGGGVSALGWGGREKRAAAITASASLKEPGGGERDSPHHRSVYREKERSGPSEKVLASTANARNAKARNNSSINTPGGGSSRSIGGIMIGGQSVMTPTPAGKKKKKTGSIGGGRIGLVASGIEEEDGGNYDAGEMEE